MLKDGLKEVIKLNLCASDNIECKSINELMKCWYIVSKHNLKQKDITYKGEELKIIYEVVTDEKGKVIEETDFITIRKDLEEQIKQINDMVEEKVQ